jgi:hypothetical protein
VTTVDGRPKLRGADHRLFRGYGPLVGIVVVLLLVAFLVPTVQPEERRITTSDGGVGPGGESLGPGGAGVPGSGGAGTGAGGVTGAGAAPPGATVCEGRQVPGDPYSPPCVEWNGGDNGGATSPGVTATEINVSIRLTEIANIAELVKQFTGGRVQVNETVDDVIRTARVLTDYFNSRFQFYGRKIVLKFFQGQGDLTAEALGGGQVGAQADAVNAAQQQEAFADALALTQPYSEALVDQKVIAFNQLYLSKEWYDAHSPYAFSIVPDCTKVVLAMSDFAIKSLASNGGAGVAEWAGGDLKGKPRKIAVVAPDNPVYQQCVRAGVKRIQDAGIPIADVRSYPLDINSITNTTPQNLVSALSGEGITTVVLATDPVLPFFMTSKAQLQEWQPEWILTGVGLTDADYVGQLMQQDSWTRAFGVSFLAAQQPVRASDAYFAYKEMDPNGSIAELSGQLVYYALEMAAIAIQMAGPNLTPESIKFGLARYPGGTGQAGGWLFPPENPYTPNIDGRIVWWDPTAISNYNGQPGSYRDNGERYALGQIPAGPPPIYLDGPPP